MRSSNKMILPKSNKDSLKHDRKRFIPKLLCAKSRDDAATVHLFSKPSFGEKKPLDEDDNREIAVAITS